MKLSVIIPTYNRPDDLVRLFDSILGQLDEPEEVIVVIGPEDERKSVIVANEWATILTVMKFYEAERKSVIHSINLGFSKARNEIICLLDDDVWLPPDWSIKIKKAFEREEKMGAFGGRDRLQIDIPGLANPPLAKDVGIFNWSGHKGNHHCGSQKSPVKVDVIKGVNLSFRRSAFACMQIEPALEGNGAETCWEVDICQRIILSGFYNLYDNNNYVLHFSSPRPSFDNRTDVFSAAWPKRIFNESFVMARFRPATEFFIWALRFFFIGTHVRPGIIWSIILFKTEGLKVLKLPWKNTVFMCRGVLNGLRKRQVVVNQFSNDE